MAPFIKNFLEDEEEKITAQFMKVSKTKTKIECSVRLNTSIAEFESDGGKEFFKENLSKSLGLSYSDIDIKSVRQGSVIVDYTLTVD